MKILPLIVWCSVVMPAFAEPLLSSWFTGESTRYARVQASTSASATGTVTWTGQSSPVYAGVQEIGYDANYVYVRSYGVAGYVMGPWYLDSAKTTNFPNFPSNTATIYRIPRTPVIPKIGRAHV